MEKAKAAHYTYFIDQARNKDIDSEAYLGFEQSLQAKFKEWSLTTKAAKFVLYTEHGYMESWVEDVKKDLISIIVASVVVSLYLVIFLGSCTPIHCRCIVALGGVLSVSLSFFAAFGLLYLLG